MTLTLPSFAKINWTLEILGRRTDGYHELRTLLQTVSLADELTFTPIERGIEIACDHPDVPTDESNLVHRAVRLFGDLTGIRNGIRITIKKRIPVAAGLGGGSGNAAVTLLALQQLWKVDLGLRQLCGLGSQLGSDVPFFLIGGTCVGVGRGDEVYPLEDIEAELLLMVNAGIGVQTREAYGGLPPELTNPGAVAKMPLSLEAAYANLTAQGREDRTGWSWLQNDLEMTVLPRYPLLGEIKEKLTRLGACGVLMSGSGSTIFAVFDSSEARSNAQNEMGQAGWWCSSPRTLGRSEYQRIYR